MLSTKELIESEKYLSYLAKRGLLTAHGAKMLETICDQLEKHANVSIYCYYVRDMMRTLESRRKNKNPRRIKVAKKKQGHKIRRQ